MKAKSERAARKARFDGTASMMLIALASLAAPVAASAQTPEQPDPASERSKGDGAQKDDVVVTATRVDRLGFVAPTPTTVVNARELQQAGQTSLGGALADLPQFRASTSPTAQTATTRSSGQFVADLRGLGGSRTLTLVESIRPVNTTPDRFDMNSVPFTLVERTEVVTGGASAAWGSDAVSGVVNVLLDDDLRGLRAGTQYGLSSRGDGREFMVSGAFGTSFAGGRGHLVVAGEYAETGEVKAISRDWSWRWGLIENPSAPGTFIISPNVHYAGLSQGGLVLSGPAALVDKQFVAGGTLVPFNFGTFRGRDFMVGGEPLSRSDTDTLRVPSNRKNGYAIVKFDLTDSLRFRGDLLYSKTHSDSDFFPHFDGPPGLAISRDNAFLSPAVRALIPANAPAAAFRIGRYFNDLPFVHNNIDYNTVQATARFEGNFGTRWNWDAFYSFGRTRGYNQTDNQRISARFLESVNSVISPTTGQPICRSALTNPTTACVPVNLFGSGSPSREAIAYFTASNWNRTRIGQNIAGATLRGEPFSTWAGPVSIAVGGEWRRNEILAVVDPLSATNQFLGLNFFPINGIMEISEGFAETVVPIARDIPLIKSLELNGAIRVSDYSTVGTLTSWKIGATYQLVTDLRLRAARSRDVRAPSLEELYTTGALSRGNIIDPVKVLTYGVDLTRTGNPNLRAEFADTFTAGIVYSPGWMSGLNISADYYSVKVNDAISSLVPQNTVSRCFAGNQDLCALVVRDGDGFITSVNRSFVNINTFEVRGVDFELSYLSGSISRALPGRFRFRLLGNYTDRYLLDDGVVRTDYVDELGLPGLGLPRWRATASISYLSEMLSIDLRARYVHGGNYDTTRVIDDNTVPSRTYFDLGFERTLNPNNPRQIVWFGNIRNLFDADPPKLPNPVHFDVIGRVMSTGVRVRL